MIYAFDVDETLNISNGPISLEALMALRCKGHIVGLCGNFVTVVQIDGWQHLISFFNVGLPKETYLQHLKHYVKADDYVMVGNIGARCARALGISPSGASEDWTAAQLAKWRFIQEINFANGAR